MSKNQSAQQYASVNGFTMKMVEGTYNVVSNSGKYKGYIRRASRRGWRGWEFRTMEESATAWSHEMATLYGATVNLVRALQFLQNRDEQKNAEYEAQRAADPKLQYIKDSTARDVARLALSFRCRALRIAEDLQRKVAELDALLAEKGLTPKEADADADLGRYLADKSDGRLVSRFYLSQCGEVQSAHDLEMDCAAYYATTKALEGLEQL